MIGVTLTYLLTILLSKGINCYHVLTITKDMTDAGYKLKENPESENTFKKIEVDNKNWYVPFLNIYEATSNYADFINNADSELYSMKMEGLLEDLNNYEREEYEKNPTMLRAYFLEFLMELKKTDTRYYTFEDGSKAFFKFDIDKGIEIINCTGPKQYLDKNYLILSIIDGIEKYQDEYIEKHKDELTEEQLEKFMEDLRLQRNLYNKARDYIYGDKKLSKKI